MSDRPKANVYVDGFNLYRQKLQYHPDAKWLDLEVLSSKLLPTHDIQRIRYFTALIQPLLGTELLRRFRTAELVVFYAARAGCS